MVAFAETNLEPLSCQFAGDGRRTICALGVQMYRQFEEDGCGHSRLRDNYQSARKIGILPAMALISTGPGPDGVWFTDDDAQSTYGANEIIYCGYRFDSESQLYYVRNRTYNPELGRWIQRDPIGYKDGANLYGYVGGDGCSVTRSPWPLVPEF